MRSILRSKGKSLTAFKPASVGSEQKEIRRGLLKDSKLVLELDKNDEGQIFYLGLYFNDDPTLLLRQTISLLDKVVRKRSLKRFAIQGYVDRVHLADHLWQRLKERFEREIKDGYDQEGMELFWQMWLWKAHPYARHEVDARAPAQDGNAQFIRTNSDESQSRDNHRGRWHDVFWTTLDDGKPDYAATAAKIWSHLTATELKINTKPRPAPRPTARRPDPKPTGLAEARGNRISSSVRDPRVERRKDDFRKVLWNDVTEDAYFGNDIAAAIFAFIENTRSKANEPLTAAHIGKLLFDHFGTLIPYLAASDDARKKQLWCLHNHIRGYYQKLLRSTRLRVAYDEKEDLSRVVPTDKEVLLARIKGKAKSADVAELIRLGKLIVHASDLPPGTDDINAAFRQRMEYLVTSPGQNEIKRNEAFTRVWRNAVGLSQQSVRIWVEPDPRQLIEVRQGDGTNADPLTLHVAAAAAKQLRPDHFQQHCKILFGNRDMPDIGTRVSIFNSDDRNEMREILWAMLQIAGELRNRANHFCTKRRLVDLLQAGIVQGADNLDRNYAGRPPGIVAATALKKLEDLLAFDRSVLAQALVDELNSIRFSQYVPTERQAVLLHEMAAVDADSDLTYPRFWAVLRRVRKLAQSRHSTLDPSMNLLATLDTDAYAAKSEGRNRFLVNLLHLLYGSGFRRWLEEEAPTAVDLAAIIRESAQEKMNRAEKTLQAKGWFHAHAELFSAPLAIGKAQDLPGLLNELSAQAAIEERLNQTYKADPAKQKQVANRIERFKQELFAKLFGEYLESKTFQWLFELPELPDNVETTEKLGRNDVSLRLSWTPKSWHPQLYAWLHLIPPREISQLQQQIKKSFTLEGKGDATASANEVADRERNRETLRDLDRLMTLFLRVHDAGFDGTEQGGRIAEGQVFYQDPTQFDQVFSEKLETHHLSYPGSRRGLRQMLRFGNRPIIEKIASKHQITSQEVEDFTGLDAAAIKELFREKVELHRRIEELHEQIAANPTKTKAEKQELAATCRRYEQRATDAAIHTFMAQAARLTDFVRLHQVMMRIIGRLTDYTLLWEKDMHYLFLGLLARQVGGLPTLDTQAAAGRNGERILIKSTRSAGGDLPLWDARRGFALGNGEAVRGYLDASSAQTYWQFFNGRGHANPKDLEANERKRRENDKHRPLSGCAIGNKQIRNDFAHYNILITQGGRLRLNYRINAVRSLFSYDRKLKNAVSQSIKRILLEEGLHLEWTMTDDRLTDASVSPCFETHLAMVRPEHCADAAFCIPRASLRLTSMARALFEFDPGGNRLLATLDGERKRAGALYYPEAVLAPPDRAVGAAGTRIAQPLLELHLPPLGSEKR